MKLLSINGNINEQNVIEFLYNTGHFNNPNTPTGIEHNDIYKLSINDKETQIALQSYRDTFNDEFQSIKLNKVSKYRVSDNSLVDPETINLLMMDRCGLPDFEINSTGSGSWPARCHPKWPNNHAITFRIDKTRMPPWWTPVFERVWGMVFEAYAHIGMVFVREDNNKNANITVTWERGNGWIGLAVVPRNPRCGDRIWAKFDTVYRPNDIINRFAYLLAHEFGHNMGLSHSRGGVMNAILTQAQFRKDVWVGDPYWPTMRRWFSGIPVNITPPTPTPNPTPAPVPPPTPPIPTPDPTPVPVPPPVTAPPTPVPPINTKPPINLPPFVPNKPDDDVPNPPNTDKPEKRLIDRLIDFVKRIIGNLDN
jgi:hypothetical protein